MSKCAATASTISVSLVSSCSVSRLICRSRSADTYADVTVAAATQRLAGRSASRIDLDKRGRSLKFLTTDPGPSGEDDDCDVVQPRDVGSPCSPLRAGWSWLICARW